MSHPILHQRPSSPAASAPVTLRDAVEIRIFWGGALLELIELSPPRAFFIGDASCSRLPVDFTVAEVGLERAPLVTVEGGDVLVHAPPGASARRRAPGAARSPEGDSVTGASLALGDDGSVDVHAGGLVFSVRFGGREARCPRKMADSDSRPLAFFAMSALLGGALVGTFAYLSPPLGLTDDEALDRDRMYLIQQYLDAAAERERVPEKATGSEASGAPDAPAEPAHGEAGKMGRRDSTAQNHRASGTQAGPTPRPATSRAEQIAAAQEFGMIGLLTSGNSGATPAPWDDAGVGALAAVGGMFGADIGESGGMGGLGLLGLEEGGGGKSDQIGIGSIGTCHGERCLGGFGKDLGRGGRPEHASRVPRLRMAGDTRVSGSLPPEVIQRVVRQSFGRFRGCYEEGLRSNPNLEGRVTARFVIARDGSVAAVQSGGTDLPDAHVVSCVLCAYSSLTFPSPKDGIVTVSYPLAFSPAA